MNQCSPALHVQVDRGHAGYIQRRNVNPYALDGLEINVGSGDTRIDMGPGPSVRNRFQRAGELSRSAM